MKFSICTLAFVVLLLIACGDTSQNKDNTSATPTSPPADTNAATSYFIDVHDLEPGKVTFKDVEGAHQKDLATQDKYGVKFMKFWVDENKGKVYCLSQARNEESVTKTHKDAHGLIPSNVYQVSSGVEAGAKGNKQFFIDVHEMGAGKVTAKDVADAHDKDLAVQDKFGVNFTNYWVDEKKGVIMCLSEAPDSNAVKNAPKAAHGLLPVYVLKVKQGEQLSRPGITILAYTMVPAFIKLMPLIIRGEDDLLCYYVCLKKGIRHLYADEHC